MPNTTKRSRAKITRAGQVTLPKRIREALGVEEGDQIEFEETESGIVLHPLKTLTIPADQAWFWTEEWQKGEREAEEDINAGRLYEMSDPADLLKPISELRKVSEEEHRRIMEERKQPRP